MAKATKLLNWFDVYFHKMIFFIRNTQLSTQNNLFYVSRACFGITVRRKLLHLKGHLVEF